MMNISMIADVLRDAVAVVIKLGGPMLILSMVAGVVIAIFQAVTQIHEQTIGFILKVSIIVTVLLVSGGWMLTTLQNYARELFELMKTI
ncbi:MAG: flagellar biosynthetic protein FliQ [Oscillibacter sp.]|nr:flagellar biosynthetic protein FliQ [Oscillibacter sp.]